MLAPEIIDKIKREREEADVERPALQIPIYPPEMRQPEDEDRNENSSRTIVIEMD